MLPDEESLTTKNQKKAVLRRKNQFLKVFCDYSTKRLESPNYFEYIDT
jgi:hypothetical protein